MASTAKIANGTLVKLSISSVYTTIPNVIRITHGQDTLDLIDVSDHDVTSGFRQHLAALQDGDEITLEIFFLTSNVVHQLMLLANSAGILALFKIVYPDSSLNTWTFAAWVLSFSIRADFAQAMQATIRMRVEGPQVIS